VLIRMVEWWIFMAKLNTRYNVKKNEYDKACTMHIQKFYSKLLKGKIGQGYGHPAIFNNIDTSYHITEANAAVSIPKNATHIVWYGETEK
jgi:hypothetical protein